MHRFASCEKLHDQGVALCEVEDFQPLVELFERYQISNYSTAFSGIDSPGTAMAQLGCALTSIMKKQALAPKHLHGIDDRSNCFEYQVFICYLLYIFCFDGDHCDKNVLLIYLSRPIHSVSTFVTFVCFPLSTAAAIVLGMGQELPDRASEPPTSTGMFVH